MTRCLLVLLPTRNRSDLASISVASLLRVDASVNLRVMVSDNSTDPVEKQRLADYVRGIADARLVLVHPPRSMPMSEHWDWLIGQGLAGDATHVAVLTDRMFFRDGGLETAWALACAHPDDVVSYSYDRLYENRRPVALTLLPRTGYAYRLDAASIVARSARMVFGSSLPRLLNCIVPRARLVAIAETNGDYVMSVAPDYCFCFRLLDGIDSILYLDSSLMVNHAQARSNGGSISRGVQTRDSEDFLRNLGEFTANGHCPIPELMTVGNAVVNEFLAVKSRSRSGRFAGIVLPAYHAMLATEIEAFESSSARDEAGQLLFSRSGFRRRPSWISRLRGWLSGVALWALTRRFSEAGEAIEASARTRARHWPVMAWLQRQEGRARIRP